MHLARRQLIAAAPVLALPACQPPRPQTIAARPACLPPANISASRVIRTLAGLRPYRAAGFVVRAEPFGGKRLVHNYGHGGAGITLSWGTSRLAVDLGLPGHGGPVAVIGSGIVGLTTARLVQEAGFAVTLYAAQLPPHTTSNIAGGQWHPASLYDPDQVTPEWIAQFEAAMDYSWRRFQIMTGDEYGIRWLPTYLQMRDDPAEDPGPDLANRYETDVTILGPGAHPFPVARVRRFTTMYAETGHLLRQLMRDVQLAGGKFAVRAFASPAELATLPEPLIFNCTGLGAGKLFGDSQIEPVRGQLAVVLPQPGLDYAFAGRMGYMFPRGDGIICGGTFEHGEWDATPDPQAIARIIAKQQAFFAGFRCTA
ncbi:glycine/D-amino acid oxidase-like deaminating enzyme [Sphingomonas naasensis]|uniref:D-amino-acid oxidase n=1 Tax=Sphingomonas naasensis TaxID=1344951 RepID=A0A4S1WGX4_9SPHN|nr:FAD-dependent oxidoreductase [Sphingomonas naasensis]NIJ21736.1 glycine/D-amino acid oxidase-like deaminating enzyme [Sphingomonas naasensis]TGX40820.1 FAD-binding oxidoreductase [Sphingomonas naasensis]